LAAVIGLAALSTATPAHADGKTWLEGPIPVVETNDGTGCAMVIGDDQGRGFGLFRSYDGDMHIFFGTIGDTYRWTSAGTVRTDVDGQEYTIPVKVTKGGTALRTAVPQSGPALDLLHDLYNGNRFTVNAGGTYKTSFSLAGSATAIAILHRCAAAHGLGFSPEQTAPAPRQGVVEAALSRDGGTHTVQRRHQRHPCHHDA
jgi:hypothetical protein